MYKYTLVTIGPVQSYIEQSRKVVDFYNSSKILGVILKGIIEFLRNNIKDDQIILPYLSIDEYMNKSISIPNYFIIQVEESITKERIIKFYETSWESIIDNIKENEKVRRHSVDIYRLFDLYIVESNNSNYGLVYKELYEKLSIYKNIRLFYNESSVNHGKRCPVCGIRNEEIQDENTKDKTEKLCYSCYIKRKYNNLTGQFPSTVDIAVMSWEKNNDSNKMSRLKKLIATKILAVPEDKKQLYETEYYFKDVVLGVVSREKRKEIEKIYDKEYKDLYKKKPVKYYALLKADIDDLGKWMSGEFFRDNSKFALNQSELSNEISKMGKHINNYIDNNNLGKTVYTGGDDFLIFVTLDKIFNVIKEVDSQISKINEILIKQNISDKQITISKSIVIAHYTTPLQKVISTSFGKLNIVKEKYKYNSCYGQLTKNGTIITYITRSNSLRSSSFNSANSKNDICISEVNELVKYFGNAISYNCTYSIESSLKGYDTVIQYQELLNMKSIIESELIRILQRQRKTKKIDNSVINKVVYIIMKLVEQSTIEIDKNKYEIDYVNIFSFIRICSSFTKQMEGGQVDELCNDNTL